MERFNTNTYSRLRDDGDGMYNPSNFEANPLGRQYFRRATNKHKTSSSNNAQSFDYRKQKFFFVWNQLMRWLSTVIIISFFLATFKIYEKKGTITPAEKATFTAIITSLTLTLGLSIFVSHFTYTRRDRRRPLTRSSYRTLSEISQRPCDGEF